MQRLLFSYEESLNVFRKEMSDASVAGTVQFLTGAVAFIERNVCNARVKCEGGLFGS